MSNYLEKISEASDNYQKHAWQVLLIKTEERYENFLSDHIDYPCCRKIKFTITGWEPYKTSSVITSTIPAVARLSSP